jgi:hypothetical protein
MTVADFPVPSRFGQVWRRFLAVAGTVFAVALPEMRKHARPVVGHIREHLYGICGLACIDAAAFVHSTFTGLLVTGISFLVFEWKVNE